MHHERVAFTEGSVMLRCIMGQIVGSRPSRVSHKLVSQDTFNVLICFLQFFVFSLLSDTFGYNMKKF